jgi:quercetin dioxygenase-like cupin family protein
MSPRQRAVFATALLCMAGLLVRTAAATPPGVSVETLIDTSETVLGQEFAYPKGRARITAVVVTLPPGAVLAPHQHEVPLFAYVLEGELIVDYGSKGERTYRAGDPFVEAIDWPHQGRNAGRGIVKILAVYAGSEKVPNSEPAELE